MTKTDNEIKTVGDAKVEQEKKLSNHDNMKRNYDDNIKLREYVKQVGTKFAAYMMMLKVGFFGSLPDLILSYFWVKLFSFLTFVTLDCVLQEAEMESLVEKYEKQLADLDWDNVKKKKKALGLRYQSLESQKNKLEGQQVWPLTQFFSVSFL